MTAVAPTKRLYTKEEAAESLGMSVRQLDKIRRAGDITPVKSGKSPRYSAAELDRYVESLEVYTAPTDR